MLRHAWLVSQAYWRQWRSYMENAVKRQKNSTRRIEYRQYNNTMVNVTPNGSIRVQQWLATTLRRITIVALLHSHWLDNNN